MPTVRYTSQFYEPQENLVMVTGEMFTRMSALLLAAEQTADALLHPNATAELRCEALVTFCEAVQGWRDGTIVHPVVAAMQVKVSARSKKKVR